jgi:hypothetical protein
MLMLFLVYFLVLEVNHDVISLEHFETKPQEKKKRIRFSKEKKSKIPEVHVYLIEFFVIKFSNLWNQDYDFEQKMFSLYVTDDV